MDEELSIISANTRQEKIKNFFIKNKIKLISLVLIFILVLICFFGYGEIKKRQQISLSNQFNMILLEFDKSDKEAVVNKLVDLINKKDPTYSPLSLYFLIDNKLIEDEKQINEYFDVLINQTSLNNEIKNLVIYKKALFNADLVNELELLNILNPLINSNSIWRSHALYLMGEFFFNNGEYQKSKDFFQKIISIENSNSEIMINAQRRLNRDLSD